MFRNHFLAAMSALALAAVIPGCACNNNSPPDAGDPDASVDAGPPVCQTTADCTAAMLTDFVCDPTNKICQPKCTDNAQCEYIAGGFCETRDGTCRGKCTDVNAGGDYCAELGDLLCLESTGKCVEKCQRDDDCSVIAPGTICNDLTGACTSANVRACGMDSDCNVFEETDLCFLGGIQCRCVTEANDAGNSGICKRRRASCDECTSDVQCGNGTTFEPPGACKALMGDSSGKKYCLQQHPTGPCSRGYVDDGTGYCKPASNSCDDVGCFEDKDCKAGAVCNVANGLCEPRCRWDFANKEVAAPGCPPGRTCWVDNANLNPMSIYYGAGRCRPPCSNDTDCTDTTLNPQGGAKLACRTEQLPGGGMSEKRCRANGECMDDLECPEQPTSSNYLGYCDRGGFTCKLDCRVGTDPVTNKSYGDCRSPYACATDGGTNYCRLQTCVEQGGASIACSRGQYCCGEDKNADGMADPCPPVNEQGPDRCYDAPRPPFCSACQSDDECKNAQLPAWLQNACANGSKSPSCSPFPPKCVNIAISMTQSVALCAPSTYNDGTRDMNGVGRDNKGCPAGYSTNYMAVKFTSNDNDNGCNNDTDCNQGTDAGRCIENPYVTRMDGTHPNFCMCNVGAPNQCPTTTDGGVTSVCRYGTAGSLQPCIETVICLPNTTSITADAGPPSFGCGLMPQ